MNFINTWLEPGANAIHRPSRFNGFRFGEKLLKQLSSLAHSGSPG
jgi:hypothetical protein